MGKVMSYVFTPLHVRAAPGADRLRRASTTFPPGRIVLLPSGLVVLHHRAGIGRIFLGELESR